MNYIFYQTKTKYSNTGDALINRALIEKLRTYGKVLANCSDDVPEEFINELGIKDDEKLIVKNDISFILKIIKYALVRENKVYIVSGLGDSFGGNFKAILKNYIATLIFLIYRIFGIRTIRIGRSIGSITKGMAISEKIRSQFIKYYFVRDTQTLAKCKKIGIKKAKYCPDMSWLYLSDEERTLNLNNVVMLNFKKSTFNENEEKYTNMLMESTDRILKVLNESLKNNIELLITYQVDEDKEFARILYDKYKKQYKTKFIKEKITLENAKECYSNISYHISNRMHSILLGYKYGSLPIALIDTNKHIKITSTMKDSRIDYLMIDVFEKKIEEKTKNIIDNKKYYYDNLIKKESENKEEIIETLQQIFEDEC